MAGLKDIERRIKSVKNTKKITFAMKLVSTAKLKKAQENISNFRVYTDYMNSLVETLVNTKVSESIQNKLFEKREVRSVLLIVVGSSRGLAGGYNSNLMKKLSLIENDIKIINSKKSSIKFDYLVLGKKPNEFLKKTGKHIVQGFENLTEDPNSWGINEIALKVEDDFTQSKYDEVYVVYTKFISTLSMNVVVDKVLPIEDTYLPNLQDLDKKESNSTKKVLLEPSIQEVFNTIIPKIFRSNFLRACFDTKASEHASRMTAMDAATKNAGDLIESLQLTYNKLRQSGITSELLDIIGGAEAIN